MDTSNFSKRNHLKFFLFCCTFLLLLSCNIQDELANNSPPNTDPFELDTGDGRDSSDAPDDIDGGRDATSSSDTIEGDSSPDTLGDDVETCSPNCDHGEECLEHDDCISQVCDQGICAEPTCDDGIKNGDETGTDCGGPDCAPCSAGQACQADSDCGETQRSSWDSCQSPSDICAEEGTQSQNVTYNECVDSTCTPRQEIETQACTRDTTDESCGTVEYGTWSACSGFEGTCGNNGTRSRSKTTFACANGACEPTTTTETETCTRDTTDDSCGEGIVKGSWSACDYGSTCSNSGTRTRSVTTYACSGGTCAPTTTTETESCTRDTTDESCGTVEYGTWSACSGFEGTCGNDGTRSRSKTTFACANGTCEPTTTTETESCTRNTNGNSCGQGVVKGNWSSCEYGSTCSNSGTRTRPITTYSCSGGSCSSTTTTQTESCTRNTNGTSCGPGTDYGPWSSCQYSDTCAQSGIKTRTQNTYTCHSGDCINVSQQEQGSCSRNTNGNSCGSEVCDDWPLFCPISSQQNTCSSSKERECTRPVCSAGTCSGETTRTETQQCTASSCTCSGNRIGICSSDGLCDCSPGSGDHCNDPMDCGFNEHCCVEPDGNRCRPNTQFCLAPYL